MYRFNKIIYLTILIMVTWACHEKPDLPDPLEAGWEGNKVCEVLHENSKLRVLKCTFPPDVGHETHYHEPHVGYTLSGGTFKIDDAEGIREVSIPDGYSWSRDTISTHTVKNIGNTTSTFLIIEYK